MPDQIDWVCRDQLLAAVKPLLGGAVSVLDIGPGIRPQTIVEAPRFTVCVEAHSEYVEVLKERLEGQNAVVIQGVVPDCLKSLPSKCVDIVTMLDVIEHLPREAGEETLRECIRVTRQQVVVFTPVGFMPQDHEGDSSDGWGMKGMAWQIHRSGWIPSDFGEAWHVVACKDFHLVNGAGQKFDPPFGAMWAVYTDPDYGHSPMRVSWPKRLHAMARRCLAWLPPLTRRSGSPLKP